MTATRKYLAARRERNRELGKADMLNRCGFCKRAVAGDGLVDFSTGRKYCNDVCWADDIERQQILEARR